MKSVSTKGGWPTPKGTDADKGIRSSEGAAQELARRKGVGADLPTLVASTAGWPTPTTRDHKDGDQQSCQHVPVNALLGRAVHLSAWPTPNCPAPHDSTISAGRPRDPREGYGMQLQDTAGLVVSGPTPSGSPAETANRGPSPGRLNPIFSLWLMGYGIIWLVCAPLPKPRRRMP